MTSAQDVFRDSGDRPRVALVQDGARLHYAIPIALQRAGILEAVYTNWYSRPGSLDWMLAQAMRPFKPTQARRMLDRFAPELDSSRVRSQPIATLQRERRRKTFSSDRTYDRWEAQERGKAISDSGFGRANVLFGFIRNLSPDLLKDARKRDLFTIGDQMIAPALVEMREDITQRERFTDWVSSSDMPPYQDIAEFERRTWELLDRITCASQYVRDGLLSQGIAADKITVNPYPIDTAHFPVIDRSGRTGPITVGFVGGVNLRKGTPYFFEVAKRFDPAKVRFVMVGPVAISAQAVEKHRGPVELTGVRPRSEIASWLQKFDVYFFPSTCEGSAGSVSEAMASGLPVVTSPNSGSVVEHGRSGYIFAYDQIDLFAGTIERLAADRELRLAMGRHGRSQIEALDIDHYAAAFCAMLGVQPESKTEVRS